MKLFLVASMALATADYASPASANFPLRAHGDIVVLASVPQMALPWRRNLFRDGHRGSTASDNRPFTRAQRVVLAKPAYGPATWNYVAFVETNAGYSSVGTDLAGWLIEPQNSPSVNPAMVAMAHGANYSAAIENVYARTEAAQGKSASVYEKREVDASGGETTHSFDITSPFEPAAVMIAGRKLLRYELHLSSFTAAPLTVTQIEVVDAKTNRVIVTLEREALATAVAAVATEMPRGSPPVVAAGKRSVAYIDLDVTEQPVPMALRHRITFVKRNETFVVAGGLIDVDATSAPILGPPLSGGPWTAIYLPNTDGGHRRFIYAVGGKARIPGRFAIDWMPAPGNPAIGADVLAVADARVVAAHDDVPQPEAGKPRKEVSAADEAGNYIILALPDGRYVHYQHMMPGLTVKPGDRVKRGQRLGRVGSTGQVTAPHLHFHVSDGVSLLGSEGQPFALSGGTIIGSYPTLAAAEAVGPWQATPPRRLGDSGNMVPPPLTVVQFDEVDRK